MSDKQTIFDKFFDATEAALKIIRKPFAKNIIKRKFSAAIDDAEMQKLDAEESIMELYKDFANPKKFDVQQLLAFEETIKRAGETIDVLKNRQDKIFK